MTDYSAPEMSPFLYKGERCTIQPWVIDKKVKAVVVTTMSGEETTVWWNGEEYPGVEYEVQVH